MRSSAFSSNSTKMITLALIAISCISLARAKPMICVTNATDGSAICFDGDQTLAFSAEKFKQINSYDVIDASDDLPAVRRRRKPRACKGWNFYKRCSAKFLNERDQFACRYERCHRCVFDSYAQHCPFCVLDKATFCPAVETCTCPWRAGKGMWESCRKKASTMCGFVQNGYPSSTLADE
uniref:Uncharacterized protein n=1 Tax=Plectus sambesii TaxID=2011161 RepID=A0A914VWD6_9BILA